ncbi:12743_t:CDS:2 [Rhizophagus irregularis]|nr:12743_t:CDS:2 [Rhizophagus irregularis]
MVRKKGPVWDHFEILNNAVNSHPHVRCKYCPKEYKRAVPKRMQFHLDKNCAQAPNSTKSQSNMEKSLNLSLSKELMEFKNWIIKFIDTEHLQGLRNIKQLISVAHLSRSLIKRIQETQPELEHDENEADSTLKISDSIFDANEYLKMDDTILNKIEYSNDPKEINEEKIIAYQNNDGLKVDDIIVNRLVLNYVMIT